MPTRTCRFWRRLPSTSMFKVFLASIMTICLTYNCLAYVFYLADENGALPITHTDGPEVVEQAIRMDVHVVVNITLATFFSGNVSLPSPDESTLKLQKRLLCLIRHGALPGLSHDEDDSDTVPEEGWKLPRNPCVGEPSAISRWSVPELCSYLVRKQILLVGSQATYILHNRLLDLLPSGASGSKSGCPGAAYCTWHEVCVNPSPRSSSRRTGSSHAPPGAAPRHRTAPRNLTDSAVLRFSLATTLRPSPRSHAVALPFVSPLTGVREHDAHDWPERARRADVLIVAKNPVPAPAWAYYGNNAPDSKRKLSVRVPAPGSSTWRWAFPLLSVGHEERYRGAVGAAWKATVLKWTPELMDSLLFLGRVSAADKGRLLVWLGPSFLKQGCAWNHQENAEYESHEMQFIRLLRSTTMDDRCIFHNAQVYMQHLILTEILSHFNISYIPDANPAPFPILQQSKLFEEELPRHNFLEAYGDRFLDGLITILRSHKAYSYDQEI